MRQLKRLVVLVKAEMHILFHLIGTPSQVVEELASMVEEAAQVYQDLLLQIIGILLEAEEVQDI